MDTKIIRKTIHIHNLIGGNAIITYPTFTFPDKCVVCGNPKETSKDVILEKRKLITSSYITGGTQSEYAQIEMKIEIPLCNNHKKEIDQKKGRFNIIMAISIILGCIVVAIVSYAIPQLTPGNTLERIIEIGLISLIGGGFGGVMLGGIVISIIEQFRKMLKLPTYCINRAYIVSLEDDPKNPTMRVSVETENDQIRSEIR